MLEPTAVVCRFCGGVGVGGGPPMKERSATTSSKPTVKPEDEPLVPSMNAPMGDVPREAVDVRSVTWLPFNQTSIRLLAPPTRPWSWRVYQVPVASFVALFTVRAETWLRIISTPALEILSDTSGPVPDADRTRRSSVIVPAVEATRTADWTYRSAAAAPSVSCA